VGDKREYKIENERETYVHSDDCRVITGESK
jgi:hypothetical protein